MNLIQKLKGRALRWSLPKPFECRHIEYSTISCVDDDPSRPTERLIEISLRAIERARTTDLLWISKRMKEAPKTGACANLPWIINSPEETPPWPQIWPGEHYRLLAGFVDVLKPRRIIEVGTLAGLGTLALTHFLPEGSEIVTLDIFPWHEIPGTAFVSSDFESGRIRQVLGDLSDRKFFDQFSETMHDCDLLFVDAPKNVVFERTLLQHLETISLPKGAVVIFDDTRNWNMLKIWRDIKRPKMDLTSFGHWTGTGIIDWNG